jgi:hypothetical protein
MRCSSGQRSTCRARSRSCRASSAKQRRPATPGFGSSGSGTKSETFARLRVSVSRTFKRARVTSLTLSRRRTPQEHRRAHHTRSAAPRPAHGRGRAASGLGGGRRVRKRFLAGRGIRAPIQPATLPAYVTACAGATRHARRVAEPLALAAARPLASRVQWGTRHTPSGFLG